jgi:hypothetical protein
LLYSTVAAAVLAVRAQLVGNWDRPWIMLDEATTARAVRVIYATEILVAVEENRIRVRRPVAFLRDGQKYAMAAIAFVAVLAVLSVAAAALKPPANAGPGSSPVPPATAAPLTPSPSVAPSVTNGSAPAPPPTPTFAASPSH